MSDLGEYLPLSNRATGGDESSVSNDWRVQVQQCAGALTDLLDRLTPEEWSAVTLDGTRTVSEVAHMVVARLEGPRTGVLRGLLGAVIGDSRLEHGEAEPALLLPRLRALADPEATRRRTVGDLTEVVVAGYDIAATLLRALDLPSTASGAVVLARMAAAPVPLRAVVGHRTLRATDAEWAIGRGPELAAPASELVLFLFGRRDRLPG